MPIPRLKKANCSITFYTAKPCPNTHDGRHFCNLSFELKPHEAETLAGVHNRVAVVQALARAKHKVHRCDCKAKGVLTDPLAVRK